jgi:hypothetical protein
MSHPAKVVGGSIEVTGSEVEMVGLPNLVSTLCLFSLFAFESCITITKIN